MKKSIKHEGPVIDSAGHFNVIECNACKFKHVVPFPTLEELDVLYKEEFYSTAKPKYFASVEADREWWMETYRSYYHLFEKFTKGRKLLEIGSGPGYFLKCGQESGWDTLGIEPSPQAYEYSGKLGVKAINSFFSADIAGQIGQFDVVYMNTVLEHVLDPRALIENANKVLKPSGIICVVSPNEYNPLQIILKERLGYPAWWVAPPQHINYFDFHSIRGLLKNNGFMVLENLGTFPMEFFLLAGANYVGHDDIGKKCHAKRMEFEINMLKYGKAILEDFYKFLAKNNIGREFLVLAKKEKI
ncbi:SAM-dependent methyltransferase [Candidatus Giovannonibacteria bacterium RIFCSPHIGHO2_01_FULL_45_33]|uniref:SAM-dependent methyltransferase n=1 Tax=Candidatus Giovannonibacteria bacterium RIFCSPLOWO2_01_FULL_45_34 TaxID=1798351 RepID=A0A1F5WZD9_9BACT|nr:MAG: SAM-dependent methyltransferase [Candidatus Giovannonibacteria bacterium RIFCSPHIGHO2_01_FULL_45_33]OGF70962.1 MAG: SAM-dependent methyltransferase [Candidatus Giovannonibacteria bacterium RIFCSPHIGHO2_02_FULL_44_11]OGF80681.1 MAG: SAM-dependent methyltransferase [Candidatus Giovannonibacteria bacterium RIFCSPLOWO2_01_FULL_45_34]